MTQTIDILTTGDLRTVNGLIQFRTGINAALQNCQTAMMAVQGEMMYAMDEGMPYKSTAWEGYNSRLFEAAARGVILAVQDVTGILSFYASNDGGMLSYSATIQTVFGVGNIYSGGSMVQDSAPTTGTTGLLDYSFFLNHSALG